MPHISIKAETLFHAGSLPITNALVTSTVVTVLFIFIAVLYQYSATVRALVHMILSALYGLFAMVFHSEKLPVFFPLVSTFFLYIIGLNWFGLLPGVGSIGLVEGNEQAIVPILRGGTADLNTTLGLSFLAIILVQAYGIKYLGFRGYISKFINLKSPIAFGVGLLEIISELSRAVSLAFRLFGNILAGEILLGIIAFLVPVLVSLPFLVFEIFVGFIQATVFAMLVAIFLSVATSIEH